MTLTRNKEIGGYLYHECNKLWTLIDNDVSVLVHEF